MRKILFLVILVLAASRAFAQTPPPTQVSSNCANTPRYGGSLVCWDTTANAWYYWNFTTGAFTASATGTLITSGAGDFGVGTSQTGGVLTGTVVNGSNMAGSASIPNSALVNPPCANVLSAKGSILGGNTSTAGCPLEVPGAAGVLVGTNSTTAPTWGNVPTANMPANPAVSATNSIVGTAGSNQALLNWDAPLWFHYFGDASESDPNPSGTVNVQGVHFYPTLTVSNGNTLNVTFSASTSSSQTDKPNGAFIAFVQGACTIAGTIQANSLTPVNISGWGGGSGGAGGWGSAAASAGTNSIWMGGTSAAAVTGGGAAPTSSSTPGGNGNTPDASAQKMMLMMPPSLATCGGAPGTQGGSSGGAGGTGGGCVYLICGSINFTGTINVAGGNGNAAGSSGVGGGGGGGGGAVVLAGRTVINSGTITLTGGTGGASFGSGTSTAGGNGGTGWSKVLTLN